jgi:hypothetical protein
MTVLNCVKFQLAYNRASSSTVSFSVEAASICADILSRSVVFQSDFITIMKVFSDFLVNTLNIPNNSVIDFVLLDSMDQREKLSGKAKFGVIGSEIIIYDGGVKHDVMATLDEVFVSFSFFGQVILF